jgi:hypothetical protein
MDWTAHGIIGAERVLYGVTDSLTVGATWAAQDGTRPAGYYGLQEYQRGYPTSSLHRGGQVSWLASERLQFVGDVSFSNSRKEQVADSGRAYKVKADLFPVRALRLSSQIFEYSPGFFNGENTAVRDRAGYAYDLFWNINRRFRAVSAGGSLRNNLDGLTANAFRMNFQKIELASGITPRVAVMVGANRMESNALGAGPQMLYTLRVQASLPRQATFEALLSKGARLDSFVLSTFSNGLNLPGFSLYQTQSAAATVRVPLRSGHLLGASYLDGPGGRRASIVESFSPAARPFRVSTELGYDVRRQDIFFFQRAEYRFDRAGRKAVGIDVRRDLGRWRAMVNLTFSELFRGGGGRPTVVADPSFTADRGAVFGKVFADANADGRLDPGEPGVEAVTVLTDNGVKTETDKDGNFVIPASGQGGSYRVFLDIDSVPAIYSPTHGMQTANIRSGNLTEINLGVSPLNSVSGMVEIASAAQERRPMYGIRVSLKRAGDNEEVGDSVTGQDGSYYLSDVRPGLYFVEVDPETLPAGTALAERRIRVEIRPAIEPQDLKLEPFHAEGLRAARDVAPTVSRR